VRSWLIVNPYAHISESILGEGDSYFEIVAPRPHSSLLKTRVSRARESDLYGNVARISQDRESAMAHLQDMAPLRSLGLLVRRDAAPRWPRFSCRIDDRHLAHRISALSDEVKSLLARTVYFEGPPDVALADSVTGLSFPYWNSPVRRRGSGARFGTLRAHELSTERDTWDAYVDRAHMHLREHGYTEFAGAIPSSHLTALRRYFRALRAGGFLEFDTRGGRYIEHENCVAAVFHRLLTPLVTTLAGEPLKPSYTFLSAFRRGGWLEKHRDRAQCEYTISLLLDFEPRSRDVFSWPLMLEVPSGTGKPRRVAIRQRIGDMLLFRGRELTHSRPRLRTGSAIHLLFHYVRPDFQGPLG